VGFEFREGKSNSYMGEVNGESDRAVGGTEVSGLWLKLTGVEVIGVNVKAEALSGFDGTGDSTSG